MTASTLQQLENRYRDILHELIDADDKTVRTSLVKELQDNTIARNALSPNYAHMRYAIDAITSFLTIRGFAATENEIIEAVVAGGFRGGGKDQQNKVFWSIRVHLNGTAKRVKKLRKIGDLVGLYDWPGSRFAVGLEPS